MELSGSARPETGWEPLHLTAWRGEKLVGAAPAYRKHHSLGEYIYDFSWASAARSAGVRYYPKLLVGVPLSPATAPRFLIHEEEDETEVRGLLVAGADQVARGTDCSSVHIIFPTATEAQALSAEGWIHRLGMQYHWRNPGYRDYEQFLSRFDSKRRHQLRRERAAAAKQEIEIRTVRGEELTEAHADLAYLLYETTCEKNPWGQLQLNRDFFRRVFDTMGDRVEVVVAELEGRVVAGAFNLLAPQRLYGRYWGCFEEHPFLHFNVCFYHSIAECIEQGREVFEPGAGGEHKIARGFQPTAIHSLHRLFDSRLNQVVEDFVGRERLEVEALLARSQELSGLKPWP